MPLRWLGVLALLLGGCRNDARSTQVRPDPAGPAAVASPSAPADAALPSPPPPPPGPAVVERTHVAHDTDASFVRALGGASATRIVFLPGLCSNAYAYLQSFPEAARAHGGVVAIDGDKPCGAANSGFRSFTWDPKLQKKRIEAALDAMGATAPPDGFTLVGYSAGASIAEMAHQSWPDVFPRLVLIAPPDEPRLDRLATAKGVVSMSCSLDVPARMKNATKGLTAKGVPSIYLEMPKCTHGNVSDGERVFGEAFDWLDREPWRPSTSDREMTGISPRDP